MIRQPPNRLCKFAFQMHNCTHRGPTLPGAWGLVPLEIKLSATPRPTMVAGIREFREVVGESATKGYLVHPGEITLPLGPHATAVP